MERLPNEILQQILQNLCPYRDLPSTRLVCKKWLSATEAIVEQRKLLVATSLRTRNVSWSWDALEDEPSSRWNHCCARYGQYMYVFGGSERQTYNNDVHVFNLSQHRWRHVDANGTAPAPRRGCTIVAHRGKLFLHAGGDFRQHTGDEFFNDTHTFKIRTEHWDLVPCAGDISPSPRAGGSASVVEDLMVTFGGYGLGGVVHNDVWLLNMDTSVWQQCEIDMEGPSPRCLHSQFPTTQNKIIIYGGSGGEGDDFSDMWLLDIGAKTWTSVRIDKIPCQPVQSCLYSPVMMNEYIVVCAGGKMCPYCGKVLIISQTCPSSAPEDHAERCTCARVLSDRLQETNLQMYVLDCTQVVETSSCEWFDYVPSTWSPPSRRFFSACAGLQEIVLFGGVDERALMAVRTGTTVVVRVEMES